MEAPNANETDSDEEHNLQDVNARPGLTCDEVGDCQSMRRSCLSSGPYREMGGGSVVDDGLGEDLQTVSSDSGVGFGNCVVVGIVVAALIAVVVVEGFIPNRVR